MSSTDAFLAVGVEGLAVGIFALIASSSDEAGSIMIVFMSGLWVIWAVSHSNVLASLSNVTGAISAKSGS